MTTGTEVDHVQVRIAKVVGLRAADGGLYQYVVLEELAGDRQLAIELGHAEAFSPAARLGGTAWPRPMTYQFVTPWCTPLAGGSGRCGPTGWLRAPTPPPLRWKARLACGRWTRGAGAGTDLGRARRAGGGGGQTSR
jgi:hypothetical protein